MCRALRRAQHIRKSLVFLQGDIASLSVVVCYRVASSLQITRLARLSGRDLVHQVAEDAHMEGAKRQVMGAGTEPLKS